MNWSNAWLRTWALEPKYLGLSFLISSALILVNALISLPQFPNFFICKLVMVTVYLFGVLSSVGCSARCLAHGRAL